MRGGDHFWPMVLTTTLIAPFAAALAWICGSLLLFGLSVIWEQRSWPATLVMGLWIVVPAAVMLLGFLGAPFVGG